MMPTGKTDSDFFNGTREAAKIAPNATPHRDHRLQDRRLGQRHAQRHFGPLQHDELQRRARTPEQRRHGERNLSELVTPQHEKAVGEIGDQADRPVLLSRIARAGVGNAQIEQRGDHVNGHDHDHRGFRGRVHGGDVPFENRRGDMRADQRAAEHRAENDRADRGAFDPAVRGNEPVRRQQFGENAVFGGRVGRRAEADDAVRNQRMRADQHRYAANHLDRIGDEHHASFRTGVGECAHEGGKNDVRQHKKQLEQRRHPVRSVKIFQQSDSSDQKRIVGQRRKKLRGHDGVKTFFHLMRCCPRCGLSAPAVCHVSGLMPIEMGCAHGFIS
ncbi:hypothetical protein OKW26_005512 [Paraburkholderia sp. 32]